MAATLETTGGLERRLNITVPMADINSEVESRLKRLARNVKMAGFRPGKVPLKVVAQQYGDQVKREVLGDVLEKSFGEAVREQNLKVAGMPRFEPRTGLDAPDQFEASATFEIYPEVTLGDLSQSAVKRPVVAVGEADVDKTLDIMRKQRATYEPVTRAAAAGDQVLMDYRGTIDGQEFQGGAAQGAPVVVGEGRLLPDFEKNLVGAAAGESRKFELRFPDDYGAKEVAGKTAVFEVTIRQVVEQKLPPVDADFARALGVADGDVAKMRAEVRANLEREVKARVKAKVKDQAMQGLVDTAKLEVPKSLVQMEIERLAQGARQDLEARGVKVGSAPLPPDLFEAQAARRVTLGLILAEVVKAHGLQARPEQVRAVVEEQAQTYERPDEVVKWFYQSPDRLRDIEAMVVEDNVVDWVLKSAKVEDVPTAFDDLMGAPK
jgi:trigger factor